MPESDKEEKKSSRGPVSRARIESLSDLVFGLTLSIGALALITQPPSTPDEMNSRIFAFIFDFVVLIAIWLQYTAIMSRLPTESGRIVLANALLLLLIILMSYLINGITWMNPPLPIPANTAIDAYASQLYGLDLAGVGAILAFFAHELSTEEKHLLPAEYLSLVRLARSLLLVFALIFLISALPQAWDWRIGEIYLRVVLWWIPLAGTLYLDARIFLAPSSLRNAGPTGEPGRNLVDV